MSICLCMYIQCRRLHPPCILPPQATFNTCHCTQLYPPPGPGPVVQQPPICQHQRPGRQAAAASRQSTMMIIGLIKFLQEPHAKYTHSQTRNQRRASRPALYGPAAMLLWRRRYAQPEADGLLPLDVGGEGGGGGGLSEGGSCHKEASGCEETSATEYHHDTTMCITKLNQPTLRNRGHAAPDVTVEN